MTFARARASCLSLAGAALLLLLTHPVISLADAAAPGQSAADGGVGPVDSGGKESLSALPAIALSPEKLPIGAGDAGRPDTHAALAKPSAAEGPGESAAAPEGRTTHPTVALSLALPSPVLGIDDETALRIVVSGDFPSPLPVPRVLCSVGRVEDLLRDGPTSFSARFLMPPAHFPQVAILVADFSHDSLILRGSLAVRLRAATSIASITDPRASVTVRVGDKDFGPVIAPADGNVRVPVVAPPGIDFALVRSVNRQGKSRQQLRDLEIPSKSRRVLVVAPEKLTAGSAGEVAVLAVEATGRPTDASTILLTSTGPRPEPLGSRAPGEARFLVRAPASLLDPTLHLMASLRGQPGVDAEADVVLVPAATSQILLQPELIQPSLIPPRSLLVFLSAQDGFGNPTDAGEAVMLVDGQRVRSRTTDDGRATILVRPPAVLAGREAIEVEAVLENGHATLRIPVSLFVRPRPPDPFLPSRYTLTPRLGVLWNLYQQPGTALLVEAMASRLPNLTGWTYGATVGYLHSRFLAGNSAGASQVTLDQIPLLASVRYRHRMERLALSGGGGVGLVLAQSRMSPYGSNLVGNRLTFAGEGATEVAFLLHQSQVVLGLRYLVMSLGKMSSGDVIVGNSGGFVLDAGYRFAWK